MDQRFDEYKTAAFERNPSNECRSLEFRFQTDGPINWNELEMSVHVEPEFTGGITGTPMNMRATSPIMIHEFNRDEYYIRSQQGALDHVIELKTKNKNDFSARYFVLGIYTRSAYSLQLGEIGEVDFYSRSLEGQDSVMDQYSGEYNLQRGEYLMGTGMIEKIVPNELMTVGR